MMGRFSSLRSDEGGVTKFLGDLVEVAEEPQGKKVGGASGRSQPVSFPCVSAVKADLMIELRQNHE